MVSPEGTPCRLYLVTHWPSAFPRKVKRCDETPIVITGRRSCAATFERARLQSVVGYRVTEYARRASCPSEHGGGGTSQIVATREWRNRMMSSTAKIRVEAEGLRGLETRGTVPRLLAALRYQARYRSVSGGGEQLNERTNGRIWRDISRGVACARISDGKGHEDGRIRRGWARLDSGLHSARRASTRAGQGRPALQTPDTGSQTGR